MLGPKREFQKFYVILTNHIERKTHCHIANRLSYRKLNTVFKIEYLIKIANQHRQINFMLNENTTNLILFIT